MLPWYAHTIVLPSLHQLSNFTWHACHCYLYIPWYAYHHFISSLLGILTLLGMPAKPGKPATATLIWPYHSTSTSLFGFLPLLGMPATATFILLIAYPATSLYYSQQTFLPVPLGAACQATAEPLELWLLHFFFFVFSLGNVPVCNQPPSSSHSYHACVQV